MLYAVQSQRMVGSLAPRFPSLKRLLQQRRHNATYQPPTPPPSKDNPHRNFWKSFGRPIAKVFLGAMFTYQITYFTWLKLESIEEKFDKDGEVKRLEARLHGLTKDRDLKKADAK
ncbi:hypothetical protein CAC42_3135 [Sphaceloma murrayae]|uniref:Uncharacterized protein n=1 Tax=Sphaceloma murrayae TaxID=2082308 RepID=A0A2K1QS27_9PEZI|nr:hypothetical protein CAC42_3135 [Sphaceloma murrayae]